jgi:hypothetical protein
MHSVRSGFESAGHAGPVAARRMWEDPSLFTLKLKS